MEEIKIRKATIDDVRAIQELNNDLFKLEKENYDTTLISDWPISDEGKDYFSDLINNHYVIVAEDNNMVVKNEYRGKGIGKSLINYFKEYCKSNNVYNMQVIASYKNRDAIEFYRKNGFEEFDITLTAKI